MAKTVHLDREGLQVKPRQKKAKEENVIHIHYHFSPYNHYIANIVTSFLSDAWHPEYKTTSIKH